MALSSEIPWLTPQHDAERQALNRHLDELRELPDDASNLKDSLEAAVGALSRLEQDILLADTLLARVRTGSSGGADWHALRWLVKHYRSKAPLLRGALMDGLGRLAEGRSSIVPAARSLRDSLQQLVATHDYLTCNELPWLDNARRVETTLPRAMETRIAATVAVESLDIPGAAFGGHLARGYWWDGGASPFDMAVARHVPDLAGSTLANADGQTLFAAMRHGFLFLQGLSGLALSRLADQQLETLVRDQLYPRKPNEGPASHQWRVAQQCGRIRTCLANATLNAAMLGGNLAEAMVLETAAAALVANPVKLRQSLGGTTVELDLFIVALVCRSDVESWHRQRAQFQSLAMRNCIPLQLCGPDGAQHTVNARIRVRQIALSAEPRLSIEAMERNCGTTGLESVANARHVAEKLLGRRHILSMGGDVKARVDVMNGRVAQLDDEIAVLEQHRNRIIRQPGADHHHVERIVDNKISGLKVERARIAKDAIALEHAAQQLKAQWRIRRGWPIDVTGHQPIGARLALVGYLMGETPLLSCASGSDLTRQLISEAQFLATVADNQNGHLPPFRLNMETWGQARAAFTPE